ncbi:MAG TPA: thermonuclease [Candidatus Omnitrophica bacterium]|nr:thermonuclease [Candidatus Omnitrophota bacterium]
MKKGNYKSKTLLKFLPLAIGALIITAYPAIKANKKRIKFSLPFKAIYDYNDILVTYVADGDTVKLEDGSWIRFIGIDTPEQHESDKLFRDARRAKKDIAEIKKLGVKAYNFTKSMLLNKRVRLEFDVEKRDKYDRLLAYIFLKDGTFINALIIKEGYGRTMNIAPNVKYADLFRKLQIEAKSKEKGFWGTGY